MKENLRTTKDLVLEFWFFNQVINMKDSLRMIKWMVMENGFSLMDPIEKEDF
jgi:hypothetical protein